MLWNGKGDNGIYENFMSRINSFEKRPKGVSKERNCMYFETVCFRAFSFGML